MTENQAKKCPGCGGSKLYWDYSCHTYPGFGNGWMSCMNCGSAIRIGCQECTWGYEWGLNPSNPRAEKNELNRPDWLEGEFSEEVTPEGIPFWEDVEWDEWDGEMGAFV